MKRNENTCFKFSKQKKIVVEFILEQVDNNNNKDALSTCNSEEYQIQNSSFNIKCNNSNELSNSFKSINSKNVKYDFDDFLKLSIDSLKKIKLIKSKNKEFSKSSLESIIFKPLPHDNILNRIKNINKDFKKTPHSNKEIIFTNEVITLSSIQTNKTNKKEDYGLIYQKIKYPSSNFYANEKEYISETSRIDNNINNLMKQKIKNDSKCLFKKIFKTNLNCSSLLSTPKKQFITEGGINFDVNYFKSYTNSKNSKSFENLLVTNS